MSRHGSWFVPYVLNPHNIHKVVEDSMPGVYVLGVIGPDKKFRVKHIKSAQNVKAELQKHLGKYQVFMYKPFRHLLNNHDNGQQKLRLAFA